MKIAFHGAARTVTGSKHLLTLNNGKKYLLDCGLFQGMRSETDQLNEHFGFDVIAVDYLILSHAHIDHCGLIPKLVKEGFKGTIFSTPGSKDLASILLEDSAGIQESDVRYDNKKRAAAHLPPLKPLYDQDDVINALPLFESIAYNHWYTIDENVSFLFTDAGHIIGSAAVHLKVKENNKETRISFSGDVGRYKNVILKAPEVFPQADYLLLESTYGNSLHKDQSNTPDDLLFWVEKTCIQKRGKLIIPAFSVGRTQEILFFLNQLENEGRLPVLNYYVDSPLSQEATQVVKDYPQYFNEEIQKVIESDLDPFDFKGLVYIKTTEESKLLNDKKEPCVIISASGMADAGRVKHHIKKNIEDSRNSILFTGYCEPNSLGGKIKLRPPEIEIYGSRLKVNAEIGEISSMSAHADYEDLYQFLECQDPKQIKKLFLVHGEYDVQQAFRERLLLRGFADVEIPSLHSEVELN